MTVRADSAALAELIDPAAEVERLGTGFTFTEGPVWNREGGFLLFSDMPGNVRRRWSPQDGITEVRRPNDRATAWSTTRPGDC